MLAVAQAIAVTIIGMRRVVWLSLIPVFSFPCLHVLSRTGSDPTGRCGMVGVQRVESGDFHRGRPVFARLQTELACRFRRTADGEWSSSFPSTYMQNRLIPTFSRYLPKFLNKKNRDAFRHPLLMSCYRSRFAGGSRMASRFNVGFGRGGYLLLLPNLRWVVRSLAADRMTLRCHRLPGPGSRLWPCPSACGQRP